MNEIVNYNPDILSCLANLSNDEVFTPPELVNEILDKLPSELFKDKTITFLDPVTKSGVFLREIAKRLMEGLKDEIPDKQLRINHIFNNQIFGIAITELTSMLARRSVYCSKKANSKYSIAENFNTEQGNILYEKIEHTWNGMNCDYCGASKQNYLRSESLETYAYKFIHVKNPKEIFDMKFDVIIGNPPYQMSDGGGTGDSAKPIYNLFIEQAIKLNPTFLSMIVPSRWMKGGKGLDKFRDTMMNDKRIRLIKDFENAKECFQGINLDGGVCYFLWDKNYNGQVDYYFKSIDGKENFSKRFLKSEIATTIIRDFRQLSIIEKVFLKSEIKFSEIVSSRKPYGISTDLFNDPKKYGYDKIPEKPFAGSIKIYGVFGNKGGAKRVVGYIHKDKFEYTDSVEKFKLFHSYAYTTTATVPPEIIIAPPKEICTETFLRIGVFNTEKEARNCLSYIKTKFFRALLSYNRIQKNLSRSTFELIPIQDFSESWNDEKLYKKYKLDQSEIVFIESKIKSMELNDE